MQALIGLAFVRIRILIFAHLYPSRKQDKSSLTCVIFKLNNTGSSVVKLAKENDFDGHKDPWGGYLFFPGTL